MKTISLNHDHPDWSLPTSKDGIHVEDLEGWFGRMTDLPYFPVDEHVCLTSAVMTGRDRRPAVVEGILQ